MVICREFNRAEGKVEIYAIESGVTDSLLKGLLRLRAHDTHKRYFLTTRRDYQKYGAAFREQIRTMSVKANKRIVELDVSQGIMKSGEEKSCSRE